MRKLVNGIVLAVLCLIVVALPVLAAAYQATYTITESNGTSYTRVPVFVTAPVQWMADNNFMDADGLDTRVATYGGTEHPHMVASDRILTAIGLNANSQQNLYFSTGNTPLADFYIILGQGGYFTVNDDAAIELGDNFRIALEDVYISDEAGIIASKPGAIEWTRDGAGNVVVLYSSSTSITGDINPDADGTTIELSKDGPGTNYECVYDANDATYVYHLTDATSKIDTYSLDVSTIPPGAIAAEIEVYFRIRSNTAGQSVGATPFLRLNGVDEVGVEQTHSLSSFATYNQIISRPGGGSWTASDLANLEVGISLRKYSAAAPACSRVYVLVTYYDMVLNYSVASGHYDTLELIADGTDLYLDVDGVTVDTVALGGASVPDNEADWEIMSAAVVSAGNFEIDIAGTPTLQIEPSSIVLGTTYDTGTVTVTNGDATVVGNATAWTSAMVGSVFISADGFYYVVDSVTDATHLELTAVYGGGTLGAQTYDMYPCLQNELSADDYVGAITWGSNPAGVSVILGGMVSRSQPVPGGVDERPSRDILPTAPVSDWFIEPDVSGTLATNPLRPFVTILSNTTNMNEMQAWRLLGIAFILFVLVLTAKFVQGHHVITGATTGAAIGACVAMTIFPMWALVFIAVIIVLGVIAERVPGI